MWYNAALRQAGEVFSSLNLRSLKNTSHSHLSFPLSTEHRVVSIQHAKAKTNKQTKASSQGSISLQVNSNVRKERKCLLSEKSRSASRRYLMRYWSGFCRLYRIWTGRVGGRVDMGSLGPFWGTHTPCGFNWMNAEDKWVSLMNI